jgi:hypothetical protein
MIVKLAKKEDQPFMKTDILYNLSNASRALGVALKSIKKLAVWWKVVWVYVEGQRPRIVSKKLFFQAFIAARKAAAQGAKVEPLPLVGGVRVTSKNSNQSHFLKTTQKALICDCQDYQSQVKTFGKGCCKHGYAYLSTLGFKSLSDYVFVQQAF